VVYEALVLLREETDTHEGGALALFAAWRAAHVVSPV
jgi:hypothetical protein